jgi:hypothetical protein
MNSVVFVRRSMIHDVLVISLSSIILFLLLIGNIYNFYHVKHQTRFLRKKLATIEKSIKIEHSLLSNAQKDWFSKMHPENLVDNMMKSNLKMATVKQYYTEEEVFKYHPSR